MAAVTGRRQQKNACDKRRSVPSSTLDISESTASQSAVVSIVDVRKATLNALTVSRDLLRHVNTSHLR